LALFDWHHGRFGGADVVSLASVLSREPIQPTDASADRKLGRACEFWEAT
jgi:hypothetical protein